MPQVSETWVCKKTSLPGMITPGKAGQPDKQPGPGGQSGRKKQDLYSLWFPDSHRSWRLSGKGLLWVARDNTGPMDISE